MISVKAAWLGKASSSGQHWGYWGPLLLSLLLLVATGGGKRDAGLKSQEMLWLTGTLQASGMQIEAKSVAGVNEAGATQSRGSLTR